MYVLAVTDNDYSKDLPKLRQGFIIAVDGHSSSGKGTLAKRMATIFRFRHLDTGMLYRIIAAELAGNNLTQTVKIDLSAGKGQEMLALLNNMSESAKRDYGTERVGRAASILAKDRDIRSALLPIQREFVQSADTGTILDGRDIASIVFPNADIKIFITAYASTRARRRFKQLRESQQRKMYKRVLFCLLHRDIRDTYRQIAPLVHMKDAIYLNNSHMDEETALQELIKKIKTFL